MRVLSWNINGIRTLPKYHPWNTFKSCEDILDALNADIICFQEMKSSRSALQRDAALPGHYHSFFSFPINKGGYSGVAVYTNSRKVTPLRAEEGLSGILQPKPPLSEDERVSPAYPRPHHIDLYSDEQTDVPSSLDELDSEGRALVLDFGLFVLINVYCPAETTETRLPYKMNFHLMLQERVRKLVEEEHREVMVLGDINVSATPLDHADGNLPSNAASWYDHPAREWMRKWLEPNGPMADAIRSFWPDRKGMFTCWNTRLQARETNYGARIDYVLVTCGLLPWIKHGDIQPSLKGSDHCPIYVDLHDELTLESGEIVKLSDAMSQQEGMQPPRIAAKYWEELAGKQTMLSSFFGKRDIQQSPPADASPPNDIPIPLSQSSSSSTADPPAGSQHSSTPSHSQTRATPKATAPRQAPAASTKRKPVDQASGASSKKRKRDASQSNISSFFGKPSTSKSPSKEVIFVDDDETAPSTPYTVCAVAVVEDQIDSDYRLARELSMSEASAVENEPSSSPAPSGSKTAWAGLFAPLKPPNCTVHNEPTKLWTVNKPGPNKGKKFYLCSRPVGPGYDKGKGERPREEVNHEYRCNFFKWASEVKKEALASQQRKASRT
ncbi:DNase I-like protein [Daedalea quercina L-15889]|uniref:DNA-(apurinic or apyrimidinic site) endonuclease n=1 Tax=Daedalea quercina L-15889 TaxID=1314783 RepID=A0A165LJG5_9APHY|nr:DNase I-like protein [Daedalea quercina L-15889]